MTWSVDCSGLTGTDPLAHQNNPDQPEECAPLLVPEKFPISERHLREFCASLTSPASSTIVSDASSCSSSSSSKTPHDTIPAPKRRPQTSESEAQEQPLKERQSIKPMDFVNYILDGLSLYIRNLRKPSTIPGKGLRSKAYAMGVLPALIAILVFCQSVITLVILWSSYTTLGRKAFQLFLKDQILLFDPTDSVDPDGTREAMIQLADTKPRSKPAFNYHIANLLLVISTLTYERDDNLVKAASSIMRDIQNEQQKETAKQLLCASEQTIDSKAKLLGMRFLGISELKSLGGPYAGLFYNDEAIILVFKGTSVLAFNEYLIDATIQRVKAHEYLYGEVHKGFYESLFPDPVPLDCYEKATLDKTNPFNTIMETIFDIAKSLKAKTGNPVNLWMTGHSLGGALAALTMARLQIPLRPSDPLFVGKDPKTIQTVNRDGSPRTVLHEMMARHHASSPPLSESSTTATSTSHPHFPFTLFHDYKHRHSNEHTHDLKKSHNHNRSSADDKDVIILRDCYSFASPKVGDSSFAQEFDQHHVNFLKDSIYSPVYYRVIVDKDIVPRMPPGCSTDPDEANETKMKRMFPCARCTSTSTEHDHCRETLQSSILQTTINYGSTDAKKLQSNGKYHDHYRQSSLTASESGEDEQHQRFRSLLDYRHVGQLVSLPNAPLKPTVKPSEFQTDLCSEILRPEKEMLDLLHQVEIALNPDPKDPICHQSTGGSNPTSSFCAQRQADEMDKAKARHDLDEPSRLRVPCDAERFLLTFPNVISHSPVTYQRNLVRTRFYFSSFPGSEMEKKIQKKVEMKKHVCRDRDSAVAIE
ncbi:hypothetical protein BGX28_002329 [Mortierella sp. GBA30]|nr:hypothetical protein BGX28_002329 [Mortierella sp. GBA30]